MTNALNSTAEPGASAPVAPELAIAARGLRREFRSRESGSVTAVDGVSLEVRRGTVFGLVGPDGSGKSTLIRMLSTVLKPTAGDADIFGHSIVGDPHAVKARIGYMSQQFSLYGDLTVRENLDFFARLRGVPRADMKPRGDRLLEFAGLTEFDTRQAQYLSGGMKQKLALAATLISEPDLLYLDEPTTGVDPVSRREFWRIISGLHRQGITVFVATPYMDEAERCDEVAFMADGQIILSDTPTGLKRRVPGRVIEVAVSDSRRAITELRDMPCVANAEIAGEFVRVLVDRRGDRDYAAEIATTLTGAGYSVAHVRPVATDLETAFATLIRRPEQPPLTYRQDVRGEQG